MTTTVPSASHYVGLRYDTKRRWCSYWHQLDEVLARPPASVLVVGVGSRLVPDYLRSLGMEVTTLDVAGDLAPDVLGDVRSIPLEDDAVELVLCCQVLEHVPFDDVPTALSELARVATTRAVISVPRRGRGWELVLRIPPLSRLARHGVLPSRHPFVFDGEHHWELGTQTTPRRAFVEVFEQHFVVDRSFLVPEHLYHEFFVARPRQASGSRR